MIRMGPFELFEAVGVGGMAHVWRGVHAERRVPVALKIMTARGVRQPQFRIAFRDEVRAVARLQHPGIVQVFDCGEIDARAARTAPEEFIEGSPYLAMELGTGTLMDVRRRPLSFFQQRTILLRLLDALAYAHARGVIHRDLKPANLLVVSDGAGPSLKIADFGLAHAFDDRRLSQQTDLQRHHNFDANISGTPRFIAPEQITGQWRNQGPWTDLYALGCIAYWLASGDPPFSSGDTKEILHRHLYDSLPPLELDDETPPEYRKWVEQLLVKDVRQRFRRAADAAYALRQIGDDDRLDRMITVPFEIDDASTNDTEPTELRDETLVLPELDTSTIAGNENKIFAHCPPPPPTWRRSTAEQPADAVIEAGLALFGLRPVPMVDRDEERDAIWDALLEVRRQRQARAVVIRGPAGTGKSRLAQWMTGRAHEVGAASVLTVQHGPMLAPGEGLSRMLASYLRCTGLKRNEIRSRVEAVFAESNPTGANEDFDCLALTEIIATSAASDTEVSDQRVRFSQPTERYAVIARFLDRLTADRPVILWLDDVHWSADSLHFVEYILRRKRGDSPVLCVLTARQEELLRLDEQADALLMVEGDNRSRTLALKPLAEPDHLAVVRNILTLDEPLARDVARRTSGNPLFAVQLIGDWVDRGLLESTPEGYQLRPGEKIDLPDDVHHLLVQRLEVLLRDYDEPKRQPAQRALELAATLGHTVDLTEWNTACRRLDVAPPMAAVEAMIAAGLARRTNSGWIFTHEALRECLQRIATAAGRWESHNRVCAHMIRTLYEPDVPGANLRLARHFWRGDQIAEAVEPLLEAARQARRTCEVRHARSLLERRDQALDQLKAPPDDRRRLLGWIEWAHLYNYEADSQAAKELFTRARDIAKAQGFDDLIAESLYGLGTLHRRLGEFETAQQLVSSARQIHRRLGDWIGVAKTTHSLAATFQTLGDFEAADAFYREAMTHFEGLDNLRGSALCHQGLATLMTRREEFDDARYQLQIAYDLFDEAGDRMGLSNTLNSLGELHRYEGSHQLAETYYRKAIATERRLGSRDFVVPHFNLVLTLIDGEHYGQARQELETVVESIASSGQKSYLAIAHTALVPCCGADRDWEDWDAHFRAAADYLDETGFVHKDIAMLMELAAELAASADEIIRARHAAATAARQWRGVGREEDAERVESMIFFG